MKFYTKEDLSKPETYASDMDVASLARRVAERSFVPGSMPLGDWKREHLEGKHAAAVFAAQEIAWAEYERKVQEDAENTRVAEALNGKTFEAHRVVFDHEEKDLVICGPWHEKLNAAVKRAGGSYIPKGASTYCRWWFPLESAAKVEALLVRNLVKPAEKARAEKKTSEDAETVAIRTAPSLGGQYGVVRVFDGLTKYQIRLPYAPGESWFENFKTRLKANGAKWDSGSSVWEISKAQHALVTELLKTAPRPTPKNAPKPVPVAQPSRPAAAATPTGNLKLYFHYGNIHTRPRGSVFRHKDGQIYRVVSEKTGVDHDGEDDLTLTCAPATAEETQAFIEAEIERERAAADNAVQNRVIAAGREAEIVGEGPIEWVLRDDRNPYGDTAIGLAQAEAGQWILVVQERFSDGLTAEKRFLVEEADVEAIRRNGQRKTQARDRDRLTAMSADEAEA